MSVAFNYKHLYYFWVVAKEGGMSRAAQRLADLGNERVDGEHRPALSARALRRAVPGSSARSRPRRGETSPAAGPRRRRLRFDQRHGLFPRPAAGLRRLGGRRQHGVELGRSTALFQAIRKQRRPSRLALARSGRPDTRHAHPQTEPAERGVPGGLRLGGWLPGLRRLHGRTTRRLRPAQHFL